VACGINLSNDVKRISLPKMKLGESDAANIFEETNQRLFLSPLKKAKVLKDGKGGITLELPPKSISLFQASTVVILEN
jgi:hypothetical protein